MSCRKGALIVLTLVILMAAALAPVSSDADAAVNKAECGGVSLIVFANDVEMNTLESYPVSIHLYNGNASPVTVKITDDGGSKIDLSFSGDPNVSSDQVVLTSNGSDGCSVELNGSFTTDKYTSKGDYEITIVMDVMGSAETADGSSFRARKGIAASAPTISSTPKIRIFAVGLLKIETSSLAFMFYLSFRSDSG